MATTIYDFPPPSGCPEDGLEFLCALPPNNNREWFEERREIYENQVRWPLKCLIADVARRLKDTELPVFGHPNTSRFRIYRDLRFTDDVRAYKTNMGAVFDRSGEKDNDGIIYIHIEPGKCFLAGGFYKPSVSYLRPIRERIATDPASFEQLLEETERRDLQVTSMGDTLTGMPKVFSDDREEDVAEYLRWKNLVTRRAVLDSAVVSPEFAERAIDVTGACRPLLEYVWDAEQETASGRS